MEAIEQWIPKIDDQGVVKKTQIRLTDLPFEVLQKIIGTLSFTEISKIRHVSKDFHYACADLLNVEFSRLKKTVSDRFEYLKEKMPRRSSSRRKHPLYPESELIECVHLRLNVVNIKMSKHMERKEICFYPGEILDEVNIILSGQKTNHPNPTEELFDLCTMAVEHFTDEIKPLLPSVSTMEFIDFSTNPLFPCIEDPSIVTEEQEFIEECARDATGPPPTDEEVPGISEEGESESISEELETSLKRIRSIVKKTSKSIKSMNLQLKSLNKNVNKLSKMVLNIKLQQSKSGDNIQDKSMSECLKTLNQCNEMMDKFESHLNNCDDSEKNVNQMSGITTEAKNDEEINEEKPCPIHSESEKIFSAKKSSIPSSSLPSTSQPIIPKSKGSQERKRKVCHKNFLPEEKKIKLFE